MAIYVNPKPGICAQDCTTCSDWNYLYIFDNFDAAREWMRKLENGSFRERMNPRVNRYWDDSPETGEPTAIDMRKGNHGKVKA